MFHYSTKIMALFAKKLDFEMTDKQRRVVLSNFKDTIYIYIPRDAKEKKDLYSPDSLSFSENFVLVPRDLLKGLYQRACLACRIKKEGGSYRFFSFEAIAPVVVESLAGGRKNCLKIKRLVNLDVGPAIDRVNHIASLEEGEIRDHEYTMDNINIKKLGVGHTLTPPLLPRIHELINHTLEKNDGREYALIHTHPHFIEGAAEALSDGDFYTMIHYEPALTVFSCLCFDFLRFVYLSGSMAKKLGASAFNKDGFLKAGHLRRIAEEFASGSVEDAALQKMYADAGMPLVAAQKTGNRIEVYTKLRITG